MDTHRRIPGTPRNSGNALEVEYFGKGWQEERPRFQRVKTLVTRTHAVFVGGETPPKPTKERPLFRVLRP